MGGSSEGRNHKTTTLVFVHSETPHQQPAPIQVKVPDLSDKIIRLSDQYCEGGGFADIYKCHYNNDDGVKEVAVKAFRFKVSIKSKGHGHDKTNKMIRREMGIWKRVNHPNIVPFLGTTYGFGKEGNTSLVSLWMTNGTLQALLENYNNHLTDTHRLQLLLDISNGLSYLHSFSLDGFTPQSIVHGDLTCTNVLLDGNYTAQLVDFGFASAMGDMPEALNYLQWCSWGPGAIRWAAPEHFLVGDIKRTTRADVYSLGNLMFLVLSGKFPWSEVRQDNAVMLQLSQGYKPARPESRPIQDAHWALVERCWSSIDQRPLAKNIVSSLEDFLRSCPIPQPLSDFLSGIQPATSDVIMTTGSLTDKYGMSVDSDYETWHEPSSAISVVALSIS